MHIEKLPANQPSDRFYRGGPQIAAFRGVAASDDRSPEDWVASTTTMHGEKSLGLSRLSGGRLLRDAIQEDPEHWLGPEHRARFDDDPMLLVKLLDAGQRLPVHAHPDRAFASQHLSLRHGKAEAWHFLNGCDVYLGFREEVSRAALSDMVRNQATSALLACLNQRSVEPGETVFVPAGVPHAIGAGALLVELQEPSDLSILLEWRDFPLDGNQAGHLGLGFDVALDAVDRTAWRDDRLDQLFASSGDDRVLPATSFPYFRLESHRAPTERPLAAAYSVLVVSAGSGRLCARDALVPVNAGDTLVTAYGAGEILVEGDVALLRCLPPAATPA